MTGRDTVVFSCALLAAAILIWNLRTMFFVLPDEAAQRQIYGLLVFHVPAWWTAFIAVTFSVAGSAVRRLSLSLRCAIDELHRRALISGAFWPLAFADVPIVWYSIRW